jgi:hypothetical protein
LRPQTAGLRPIRVGAAQLHHYDDSMPQPNPRRQKLVPVWRGVVEVAFIVFLFYSNLLMGEFSRSNGSGKSFAFALYDIFTATNFAIALFSALIGYLIFEFLRKKL